MTTENEYERILTEFDNLSIALKQLSKLKAENLRLKKRIDVLKESDKK